MTRADLRALNTSRVCFFSRTIVVYINYLAVTEATWAVVDMKVMGLCSLAVLRDAAGPSRQMTTAVTAERCACVCVCLARLSLRVPVCTCTCARAS